MSLELSIDSGFNENDLTEFAINRSGLALTGFFKHFPPCRLQVFGLSEMAYLESLSEDDQRLRLDEFCKRKVPAIVLTNNYEVPPILAGLALKYEIPVFRTPLLTSKFINRCTLLIEKLTVLQSPFKGQ